MWRPSLLSEVHWVAFLRIDGGFIETDNLGSLRSAFGLDFFFIADDEYLVSL